MEVIQVLKRAERGLGYLSSENWKVQIWRKCGNEQKKREKAPSRNEIPEADMNAKGSTGVFLPEENILNLALGAVVP